MIFWHENDLHLWNSTYLCKREVKWTLLNLASDFVDYADFERQEITHKHIGRVNTNKNRIIKMIVCQTTFYVHNSSRIMILPPYFPNISSPITFIEAGTDKIK